MPPDLGSVAAGAPGRLHASLRFRGSFPWLDIGSRPHLTPEVRIKEPWPGRRVALQP